MELSIQERLKDLRVERGLTLEQLEEQVNLSKSALGSYEAKDFQDISHYAIIKLAKFYGVTADYLLGLSQTRNHPNADLADLHLSDDMIELLKSGRVDNSLLCEKMLLQKEKQSIEEIGKKDKKIYERRKVSLSNIYDLLFPQKSRKYFRTNAKEHIGEVSSVKVSFCTSFRGKIKKGSLAVETALVLPLFFLGMVTLISFMDIYKLQTEHLTALCTKAKQAGMYAYLPGGDSVDDITLPDIYTYKPFGGLIPLPDVVVYNHVKVHAWTGTEFPDNGGEQGETEPMVYVTASGSVYHKNPGCSYLNVSLKQIPGSSAKSAYNKYGEHYSACEICSRNQNPAGVVYVTEQGNRYHNLESCSGLKRSVRLVKASSVSEMGACSRCG